MPTFCAMVEDRTFNEVLGHPFISQEKMLTHPLVQFALDHWGKALSKNLFQAELNRAFEKRIKAQVDAMPAGAHKTNARRWLAMAHVLVAPHTLSQAAIQSALRLVSGMPDDTRHKSAALDMLAGLEARSAA